MFIMLSFLVYMAQPSNKYVLIWFMKKLIVNKQQTTCINKKECMSACIPTSTFIRSTYTKQNNRLLCVNLIKRVH